MSGEDTSMEWLEWPYIGRNLEEVDRQAKISLQYWGEQLRYYMQFFGENCIKVYMSNHGKKYEAEPIYNELATHIIMFIKDKRLPCRRDDRLFTIANMYELLDYVSDEYPAEEKYEKLFVDAVKMQEVGVFNATAIKYYMSENQAESAMPYRAARGKEDRCILLNSGKEYYYRLPDEKTNEIDNPQYRERIEELKKVAGDEFLDFNDYYSELTEFRKIFEAQNL